ncbi:SRPK2 bound unphosphorylated [Diaporthe helianthi]|uniref:SRPK2 bound unphosphorylated n=1 Tax=Diaporthe helianthi TaxID=158607 RepID=A0A2P5I4Y6_DIAHE|nr:SRPK2 bound unphosphorylated [Diaporthe helianthi]
MLRDRYCIVHKLGFGSYSTTWLGKDVSKGGRYVAIKVMTADSSVASQEAKVLRHLADKTSFDAHRKAKPQGVDSTTVPSIWDEFTISGPNGTHQCIITTPARMTVAEAQDASYTRLFQPRVARALAAQLIHGVAFMHTKGLVHADLHLGNVLFKLTEDSRRLPIDKLYDKFGTPELETVRIIGNGGAQLLPEGFPTHIVVPSWFGIKSEDVKLHESSVFLTDFGESFMPSSEQRYHSSTPRILRPPETRFLPEEPLSYPADIWTLACSIWTTLGQRSLFELFSPTDEYVTKEQVDALGMLPSPWWERWTARDDYFDDRGELLDTTCRRMTLEDRFEHSIQAPRRAVGMEMVGEQEMVALLDMLRSMLAFIPEERPTAASLLTCDWMTKWALPDLREVERAGL